MLAALAAVIGFTGCCGTGGSCKLGCGLGAGKGLLKAGNRVAERANSGNLSASGSDCGSDCGCGSCGSDSVMSISAPYACDGGCSDGGCGGSTPMSAPSSCGCSSCDGGGAVEYSTPVEYAPVQSGGCDACSSAPASKPRGLFARRAAKKDGLASNKGMGLLLKAKGRACDEGRSLRPSAGENFVTDVGVVTGDSCGGCDSCSSSGGCESCSTCVEQTVAQMPGGFLFGSSSGERRISTGIVSDIREARGGCRGGGCAARKLAGGGGFAAHEIAGGCGKRGCRAGNLCSKCTKIAQAAGLGHPYGGAIPHTNPAAGQQPQSGIAPQYAYPYYTTRGPRDFLRDNPPSIGY